mmetsp:Transcript_71667/g.203345  ORF Transcript_71667/g.203345 Transcript_71667/m.203345 type:complete len:210 (-) Transcript_71667:882-1511(-)
MMSSSARKLLLARGHYPCLSKGRPCPQTQQLRLCSGLHHQRQAHPDRARIEGAAAVCRGILDIHRLVPAACRLRHDALEIRPPRRHQHLWAADSAQQADLVPQSCRCPRRLARVPKQPVPATSLSSLYQQLPLLEELEHSSGSLHLARVLVRMPLAQERPEFLHARLLGLNLPQLHQLCKCLSLCFLDFRIARCCSPVFRCTGKSSTFG